MLAFATIFLTSSKSASGTAQMVNPILGDISYERKFGTSLMKQLLII
jgi:hypothetical protein